MEARDRNVAKERSQMQQYSPECEDSGFGNKGEVGTETVTLEIND